MSFLLANDLPVLSARFTFPRIGAWHADIEVDSEEALSGPVTFSFADGAVLWRGTVLRGGAYLGQGKALVVGGAAGLGAVLPAKFYEDIALRTPLGDVLREAGEVLSPLSSADTLSYLFPKWTRIAGSAGLQILHLVDAAQFAAWRVLSSGEVWVGKESYPAFTGEFIRLSEDLSRKVTELDQDLPLLLPGVLLEDQKIGRVVYEVSPSGMSTRAYYD